MQRSLRANYFVDHKIPGAYWSSADYTQLPYHFQLKMLFRSTKAFVVKRLEAEGAEVVFLFLTWGENIPKTYFLGCKCHKTLLSGCKMFQIHYFYLDKHIIFII